MTGHAHHADEEQEDQNDGEEHNDDSNDIEQSSQKQDTTYSVFCDTEICTIIGPAWTVHHVKLVTACRNNMIIISKEGR